MSVSNAHVNNGKPVSGCVPIAEIVMAARLIALGILVVIIFQPHVVGRNSSCSKQAVALRNYILYIDRPFIQAALPVYSDYSYVA